MDVKRCGRGAAIGALAVVAAWGQWAFAAPAHAEETCNELTRGEEVVVGVCVDAGFNDAGNPYQNLRVYHKASEADPSDPYAYEKGGIIEGEDGSRSLSGGVRVVGVGIVNFTVDMGDDPGRTGFCVVPEAPPSSTCVFVSDLVDLPPH